MLYIEISNDVGKVQIMPDIMCAFFPEGSCCTDDVVFITDDSFNVKEWVEKKLVEKIPIF